MPEFKLRKLKGELFEILGLDAYLDKKLSQLRGAIAPKSQPESAKLMEAKPVAKPVATKSAASKAMAAKSPTMRTARKAAAASKPPKSNRSSNAPMEEGLADLLTLLAGHPQQELLIRAGERKDQLLRSLIPVYVGRDSKVEINSGMISRFWAHHGITYAAPNAAKAFRQHEGYAKIAKNGGRVITSSGIRYVETALKERNAA